MGQETAALQDFSPAYDGTPLIGPKLSEVARKTLGVDAVSPLRGLREAHRSNLAVHRLRHGFEN
jgi:hypothetical protein